MERANAAMLLVFLPLLLFLFGREKMGQSRNLELVNFVFTLSVGYFRVGYLTSWYISIYVLSVGFMLSWYFNPLVIYMEPKIYVLLIQLFTYYCVMTIFELDLLLVLRTLT